MSYSELKRITNPDGKNGGVKFDWVKVDTMLMAGCTCEEIAGEFGCCALTVTRAIEREFSVKFVEYSRSKRSKGDGRLRMHQFLKAIGATNKGSERQLEILGKYRLGQLDPKNDIDSKHKIILEISEEITKSSNPVVEEWPI